MASQIIRRDLNYNMCLKKKYHSLNKIFLIIDIIGFSHFTWDVHYEYNNSFTEQKKFVSNLYKDIQPNLIIKLHPAYKNLNEYEDLRWENFNKDIILDKGKIRYKKILMESKLIVFAYESTGFFQALAMNVPCIAFWQNELNHLRDEVKKDFEPLIKSEIIFFSGVKAAKKINQVYHNVSSWWYGDQVQDARRKFCIKYANTSNLDIKETIKKLTKS